MISPQYVDGLEQRIEELQAERDALAAHVERIKAEYGVGAPLGRLERIGAVLRESPATPLARHKAQPEREGREAYRAGKGISDNPYVNSSQPGAEAYQWHAGYKDQRDEDPQA